MPIGAPRSLALVVPCYGHAAYLPDTLASILAQTRRPDEVVFVDDCSPDDTQQIVRKFISANARPAGERHSLLVNDRNIGQSASLNRGIAAANSELIMVLNDDDYLMHDAVESMLAFFLHQPSVALIGANHISFAGLETLTDAAKLSSAYSPPGSRLVIHRSAAVRRFRLADDLSMTHSSMCFLKAAWEAVGGYWTEKSERVVLSTDRDFQIRVNAVWPVAVAKDTPLAFWRNDSSVDAGCFS